MTPELKERIQQEIQHMLGQKICKMHDSQIGHLYGPKMTEWRKSQQNKKQFKSQGVSKGKFTSEQVVEIRNKFYFENAVLTDLCKEYNMCMTNMRELLKNQSYVIDQWNYPNFELQRDLNLRLKNRIDEKIQYIKDGYGAKNFSKKFGCTDSVYHRLVKEYGLTRPQRNGNKVPKIDETLG